MARKKKSFSTAGSMCYLDKNIEQLYKYSLSSTERELWDFSPIFDSGQYVEDLVTA